jgi:hypothetical protein
MAEERILQMVLTVFGAGLVTGGIVYFTSMAIGNALRIFKNV